MRRSDLEVVGLSLSLIALGLSIWSIRMNNRIIAEADRIEKVRKEVRRRPLRTVAEMLTHDDICEIQRRVREQVLYDVSNAEHDAALGKSGVSDQE